MVHRSEARGRDDLTRAEILLLLGSAGPLSRAEIATRLGRGRATVTEHARRLLAAGMVRELPAQAGSAGRPRVPLELVPDAGHVLGLRVTVDRVVGAVIRLDGEIVEEFVREAPVRSAGVDGLVEIVEEEFAARSSYPLHGVGVALPGVVDLGTGAVRMSATLGWRDADLGATLARRIDVPVLVDNDLHASTTAELLFGMGRDHDDFLVLGIGDGVALGMVLDRRVHRGPDGTAGELGHTTIDPAGPLCNCGNRGCLQAFVSSDALIAQARADHLIGPRAGLGGLRRSAAEGTPGAVDLLHEAGERLGRAVAGVVTVLAVRAVKVIGESHILWPYLEPGFTSATNASLLPPLHDLEVRVKPWREIEHARGAASLLLAHGEALPT
ncbi:ROK family protein [Kribbella sp. NPDC059898]|uniref:ROK family protein n=1 Tax=Kribbella sp. NPDC059898 TaxID=3346995 RepID=UPI003657BFE1